MHRSCTRVFILSVVGSIVIGFGACNTNKEEPLITVTNQTNKPLIMFLGDSLTAGYGLDPDLAYPALIEGKLKAKKLNFSVSNVAESGITTFDGLNRIDWHLESKPAVLVVALGANDGLRGIEPSVIKKNLNEILQKAQSANPAPKILLVGMKAPPNMGSPFASAFENVFLSLAKARNVGFVPFLLKGVAGVPTLNLEDGIHPNAEGQKIMAEVVWEKLEGLLGSF